MCEHMTGNWTISLVTQKSCCGYKSGLRYFTRPFSPPQAVLRVVLTSNVVSPTSLLDSQHGCIASPHAKNEFGLALSANVVALSAKMNKTTPHNNQIHLLVQEIPGPVETKPPTEFDQTPSLRAVMQYIRAVNQGGWLARLLLMADVHECIS